MDFTTLKIPGGDAIRLLNEHRSRYPATGQYPFLIGDAEDLARIEEPAKFYDQDPAETIRSGCWLAAANHRLKLTDYPPRASSVRARRMAKVALKLTIGDVRYVPIKRS